MTRHISISSYFYIPLTIMFLMNMPINVVQAKLGTGLFVFGDSFYDSGVTNYLDTATMHANISPYGQTYFRRPTGRFSDGLLIPDFIAHYAHLPFPPPFLQPGLVSYRKGVDFATAAAGALNETFQGKTISLETQVTSFKKVIGELRRQFGHGNSKAMISKAVYIFNIGTNDYLFALQTNPAALTPQYVSLVVGNITIAIKEIYRLGGRKFAINNVGPLGCFPVVKAAVKSNGTCYQPVSQIAALHNLQLTTALPALAAQYPGLKYGIFDMYTNLDKRINSPTSYGFKDSKSACCGTGPFRGIFSCGGQGNLTYQLCPNPKDYVFWDSVHLSQKANSELAHLIWSGSSRDIKPYNVKTLFEL